MLSILVIVIPNAATFFSLSIRLRTWGSMWAIRILIGLQNIAIVLVAVETDKKASVVTSHVAWNIIDGAEEIA